MSENENTGGSTVPPNPYSEAALARVQELRQWREQIPRLVIPPTADANKRLSQAASVPPAFVEQTNMAMASQASLARPDAIPPAQVRDLVAWADAHSPLADELEALAQFVRYSVTVARNTAGSEALATYAIAQRLAKLPATAHLEPYVADMRRALGRSGRKLTPEEAAQKAAEHAVKAAAKVPKKPVVKALPAAPTTET